jgi:hypothetical protein
MEKATGYDNESEIGLLNSINEGSVPIVPAQARFRSRRHYIGMAVIPWRDIWGPLTLAKLRGHTQLVDVFYDTLFKEALFDDRGVWSPLTR